MEHCITKLFIRFIIIIQLVSAILPSGKTAIYPSDQIIIVQTQGFSLLVACQLANTFVAYFYLPKYYITNTHIYPYRRIQYYKHCLVSLVPAHNFANIANTFVVYFYLPKYQIFNTNTYSSGYNTIAQTLLLSLLAA